ncbi:peroxisome assembly factor 2 isoform X2 [Micropterus dolomieu]|uniref:peroxisome assembly factor 2 isoform X2 n=1 Tax=Micropterus dolomieu TaxID=147949 RepID=UPI001E8E45C4|nr:peroxisome assembly factor 2 isoform X2 [Micropterus dolomieu]
MAVQVQLCSLESFPSHLSPLDVLMLKSHLDSVFRNDTDPPTVLFTPQRPPRSGSPPGILLRVHPTTEEETAGCGGAESGSRVRLFASRLFTRHHGLQRLGSTGTVRALEPVSLDRVVLGARSRQSLRWAGAERFTGGLLELCRPGQWLLARRGEPLLLGDEPGQLTELLVLDCSPVTQGRITADTSLVLTDCWDSVDPPGAPPPCRPLRLCVSDFAHYADGLGGGRSLLDSRKLLGSGFSGVLQALECRLDVRVADARRWLGVGGQRGAAVDADSCVFVSKQLLLRLGLFHQEWVRLSRPGGSSRPPADQTEVRGAPVCRERLVSVMAVDLSQSPDLNQNHGEVGFISGTLWFNMTEGEEVPVNSCTLRMKRWRPSPPVPDARRSDSFCRSASPPFASELHIQPVVSPLYNNLSCYDNLLSEHFRTPRLVSQGDILTVPAENHPDLLENNSEGIFRCPVLFFRVQTVCPSAEREEEEGGGAYLADRQHTSLYMRASTNSPVPCCSVEGASLWSSLSPPGLQKTVDLLGSIILPHLHRSSSLSGCTVLLHGPAGSGKMTAVGAASRRLNLHLLKVDCVSVCADTPAASEVKLTSVFQRADALQPCILLLRNLQLLLRPRGGAEEDGRVPAAFCQLLHSVPTSVVVVATVSRPRDLSAGVMASFVHQVALESPTEEQRHSMLVSLSRDLHLGRDVDLERLSKLTAGFVLGDLSALLVAAGRAACRRLILTCGGRQEEDLCSSGVTILNQDLTSALKTLQDAQSTAIGAPKIPDVRWEDVGGLQQVKKEILDTVQLPLQRPELLSLGLNRTGVLLYGPPGTGKTLLAKAVATECSMTFLSVKGPELINMYVGQSEENIREVFCRARSAAPCVVFFDELDSLAPSRGRTGDSGGVMDRVVSQLLAELDTLHSSVGVFVIGATNRPDLLDQSLLRPGRFDKLVYVGINEDRVSQLQVLQAILRKFQLDSAVDLHDVVDRCPAHMTGADLYALCSDAMTAAVKRKIALIDDGLDSEDSPIHVSVADFSAALENFKPSVSDQELLRYKNIQQRLTAK